MAIYMKSVNFRFALVDVLHSDAYNDPVPVEKAAVANGSQAILELHEGGQRAEGRTDSRRILISERKLL